MQTSKHVYVGMLMCECVRIHTIRAYDMCTNACMYIISYMHLYTCNMDSGSETLALNLFWLNLRKVAGEAEHGAVSRPQPGVGCGFDKHSCGHDVRFAMTAGSPDLAHENL